MAKKIVWSKNALIQRKEIFEYWDKRNYSKTYSKKLHSLIQEDLKLISKNPKIGIQSQHPDLRIKFVKTYLIIYQEFETLILVVSFWDGRQNPTKFSQIINNP